MKKNEWANEFQYRCSNGHLIESVHAVERCPGRFRDRPCAGVLERYGVGSKGPRGKVSS